MIEEDSNQPRNHFDEEEIDLEFVQKFIQEMLDDETNFKSKNPKIAVLLESMPKKLQEYLKELQRLEKAEKLAKAESEKNPDAKTSGEKSKKNQERIKQIAEEIFIISCASNKPLEESLKFHEKCNLDKNFSKFGECGLSPLMAAMLAEKPPQDLQKLIDLGAKVNEKNAYGFTVLDFAEMVGSKSVEFLKERGAKSINSEAKQEESLEKEREKEEEREKKSAKKDEDSEEKSQQKILQRQERERERFEQEKILIAQSMMALELYAEIFREKRQTEISVETKQEGREEFVARSELKASEDENKTTSKLEIERILGVDIGEIDINQLLFNSVKDGQSMLAVLLIHCGADVNYRQGDRSVLDVAIEKGNGSLISILSSASSPDTVSSSFVKVMNNGNYTSEALGALVGERSEYKKEVVVGVRSEALSKHKESDSREIPNVGNSEKPSANVNSANVINLKSGKIDQSRTGEEGNVVRISRATSAASISLR